MRCKNCKDKFEPELPWHTWCSSKCREAIALELLAKQRKATERAQKKAREKAAKKERKAKIRPMDASAFHESTRPVVGAHAIRKHARVKK